MLEKTSGILLHTTDYTDTSIIVKAYTSRFGLQSYMTSGIRGKRSKHKASVLQPLTIAELVISGSEKSKLKRITEVNVLYPYTSIPYEIVKSTIALFLNEVLYRSLKEDEANEALFEYLKNALQILDLRTESCANFHLCFMLQLSRFLGFYPQGSYSRDQPYFDLRDGLFVAAKPSHALCLDVEESMLLDRLLKASFDDMEKIVLTRVQRKKILQNLVFFYRLHIPSFGEMRSPEVLEQVIS
ncbi:MAG: DNA repair protein RecO [Bacteroidia bacterium]